LPLGGQIDLLQEQNGNEASLLSGTSLPAGNYDWIRLSLNVAADGAVANSYIEVNGAQYPLVIPSGAQTGHRRSSAGDRERG
jgi:hypothetical protein